MHLWYKDLLISISQDLYTKKFSIIFCGRSEEYLDLLEQVEYLNTKEGWDLKISIEEKKNKVDILKDLDEYVKDIQKNAPEELLKEIEEKKAIREFENAKDSEAEVSVIATMSSGKSTLLNALIGKEILPSKNEACTATICRIKNVIGKKEMLMRAEDLEGKILVDWEEACPAKISDLNEEGNKKGINIYLEGEIPGISSSEMDLILIDTPGPNNSQTKEHKEATYKFIKDTTKNPLVLYVMNATQHATNDDATLLREISEIIREHGKQAEERFIFALNKIDNFDPEKESIEILIENSKRYLEKFGIKNPKIFPISSEFAKLIRINQNRGFLTRNQKGDLNSYEYRFLPVKEENYEGLDTIKYASIPENIKEKLYIESESDKIKALLNYSGITAIEIYIERYVNKYAKTQKVRDSIKTLKDVVDNAYNRTMLVHNKTTEELDELMKQIATIENVLRTHGKEKIEEVRKKIKNLNPNTESYQKAFKEVSELFNKTENKFKENKISKEKAMVIIDETKKEIEKLILRIKTGLEQTASEELLSIANSIIEELRNYFEEILGKINLDEELKITLESSFKLELPSTKYLISEGSYETREYVGERYVKTVSRSKWWNPFTWGDEEDIYEDIYENRTYVDLNKVNDLYLATIKSDLREGIDIAQKEAFARVDNIKTKAEESLKEVEENVENKLEELKEKIRKQDTLNNEKQILGEKIDKIIEYKEKLDSILEN